MVEWPSSLQTSTDLHNLNCIFNDKVTSRCKCQYAVLALFVLREAKSKHYIYPFHSGIWLHNIKQWTKIHCIHYYYSVLTQFLMKVCNYKLFALNIDLHIIFFIDRLVYKT